jgi:hypothetical protein
MSITLEFKSIIKSKPTSLKTRKYILACFKGEKRKARITGRIKDSYSLDAAYNLHCNRNY